MLRAEGLGKRFHSRWVFRSVEFELGVGCGLVITGKNGAGKSTLSKVIAGLISPTEGNLHRTFDPQLEMGYAALDYSLYPQLTAEEQFHFAFELRGIQRDCETELDRFGIAEVSKQPVQTLSSGQRARLKLAIVSALAPKLLVLDEPGASLDEEGKSVVAELCRRQLERGALVLATNDPQERRLGTHELCLG